MKRVTDSHSGWESSTRPLDRTLTHDDFVRAVPIRTIAGRNLSKADVVVCRIGDRLVAVKDYGPRPFLARHSAGRMLVRRECRAYEAAAGCPGMATFLGRLGPFTLATAWIEATPLADLETRPVGDAVFDRLGEILAELHDRGIAVADLHHRDVLVASDGSVHVVDFAAAYVRDSAAGPWRRWVFRRLRGQDLLAAARMRARFTGRSEAAALSTLDPRSVRLWGFGRRVKSLWDRLRGKRA